MYFSRRQWEFFVGWSNEFDLLRIGLEWRGCGEAAFRLAFMGFTASIGFPAMSYYSAKRRFCEWWYPCSECGGRFGRHDETKEHLPF
jgi:hypothetical protein